ncbi:MAG: MBL fold metallo-hydrolase [Eubacterium sp.]|nr:MBL fold metallo-hydrolase [Eubacterium sp.]
MLIIIFASIAGILLLAWIVVMLHPGFGGNVTGKDKEAYALRTDESYFKDKHFTNGDSFQLMTGGDGENNLYSEKGKKPKDELPSVTPVFLSDPGISDFSYTWFGHSAFLIQMHGLNILIDPMLSDCSSPFSWIGVKRFARCPITAEELPHIDMVFYSHDHYDHLDMDTVKKIDGKVDRYFVPLGIEKHLLRWGVDAEKIQNMAWWEEYEYRGITIACTPTQHFSGRKLIDSNDTLWASLVLKDENRQIYYSGDGGMNDRFEKIHEVYGDFDLAILECGQYSPRWSGVHMFPEEAVRAGDILHADYVTPVHWGAFVLSDHAWDDSAERFTREYVATHTDASHLITPEPGRTLYGGDAEDSLFSDESIGYASGRWWREYD